ncbi:sterol 26-hydroxylase, mitochondrial [Nematostella vectensis]|uniref:sterol 26-hydroxylase, mitochondrial n=1 Tax=Nematostella vectensis TaxID=45351 RepID=UPI0020771015|nr:sterol 26-hydroxylase, mitochondrial [Nematostella vectensis]
MASFSSPCFRASARQYLGLFRYPASCRAIYHRHQTNSTYSATPSGERVKTIAEMPGLPSLPVFGSAPFLALNRKGRPLGRFILDKQFTDVETYGKIFKLDVPGGFKIISVADPDTAMAILRNEPKYPKRFDSPLLDFYRNTRKKIPGVFFAEGPDWHKYRSVISKRILRPKEVADYVPEFDNIGSKFLERVENIRGKAGTDSEYEVENLDNELFKWSFESVAYMLFDKRFGTLEENVNPDAQGFIASVGGLLESFLPASLLPVFIYKVYETEAYKNLVYHFDRMYNYAEKFIGERVQELEKEGKLDGDIQDGERVDFFRFLLSSGKLTRDDLLASVIDLLFAGVDTTSNTMQWVFYTMGKHQDKQEKLYQEITSVLQPGELSSTKHIAKMPYLRAWLKETLRLYPVLSALPRQVPEDIVIDGYHIPAHTNFNILFYYMGRDESNFKDPLQFKPERWLRDESHSTAEAMHAFASIPFGFGTRMCVGRRIAELEMHLLMIKALQRYIITYPHNDEIKPFMRGVTIPDKPVRVRFTDRPGC